MNKRVRVEDVIGAISMMCPELLLHEESDGNVVISLNMKLVDHNYLEPFTTDEEWE